MEESESSGNEKVKTTLEVRGMTCSSCVSTVTHVLNNLSGVDDAKVSLLANRAIVNHEKKVSPSNISDALSNSGYPSFVIDSSVAIEARNMHEKESRLRKSQFAISFSTDELSEHAARFIFELDFVENVEKRKRRNIIDLKSFVRKSQLIRALEIKSEFGSFNVEEIDTTVKRAVTNVIEEEARTWRWRFFFSLLSFIPIIIVSMLTVRYNKIGIRKGQWIQFALATPVQVVVGFNFYRASYYALRKGRATMDVLIALSTSLAYFTSVYVVISGLSLSNDKTYTHHAMFKTSSMILTMLVLGKWLESSAKRRAASGVAQLSALIPDDAILYDEIENVPCQTRVPVSVLEIGDCVRIWSRSRVPVDGEIISGTSELDESMLTGESIPLKKSPGDTIFGGTKNVSGNLIVRTTATGERSVLSQIVGLVEEAQMSRAPIEALADFVSAIFVPVIVAISILVFLAWYIAALCEVVPEQWYHKEGLFFFCLLFCIETLVVACPCALGLATPTAVMVASEMGAGLGVLIRGGGSALQAAENVQTVLFDKTGTLTKGEPEVVRVLVGEKAKANMKDAAKILSELTFVAEQNSDHPLATGIVKQISSGLGTSFSSNFPQIEEFKEVPGSGVEANMVSGKYSVRVGSREWAFKDVSREKELMTQDEIRIMDEMENEQGNTLVISVVNDLYVTVYGLKDVVRAESSNVIKYIRTNLMLKVGMVTGDSQRTALSVGRQIGISPEEMFSRTSPEGKFRIVQEESTSGPTAFVGDGINDAPALARADIGIAMGRGTSSIATNAADVVCVRNNLVAVVHTLWLSRVTFRRVRLNFIWAMAYNLIGIPFAAGALYPFFQIRLPPFLASTAMALSSISVILSSISLRWMKPPQISGEEGSEGFDFSADNGKSEERLALLGKESQV